MRHAQNGDFPALAKELDERAAKGNLDDGEVRDVAKALLEHDLTRYAGEQGIERTMALSTCAKPIEPALARVAKGDDEIAAAAAWVLIDSGNASIDRYTDAHRDDPRPLWRAVATRGLVDASEGALRAARAMDDDERVRRASVFAAGDAGCASDFSLLLDVTRRDPYVLIRVDAVRALGKIAPHLSEGAARADLVDRLHDLWDAGDDPMRGAVARAWATPSLFHAGGRQQLERVLQDEKGHATVDAASALMGAGGADGAVVLAKIARDSDPAVRAHALRLLDPQNPEHEKILVGIVTAPKDAGGDDPSARVLAATALLRVEAHRGKAVDALVALMARPDKIGTDAALALADVKDARARPRLQADLETTSFVRFRAAAGLVRLGHPGDARPLLSSSDVDVRDGAACTILATPPG